MDVMLIEDHAILRHGLKSLLESECGARVVCDVATAEEGIAFLAHAGCDLAIVDLTLPGRDGLWATRQIKQLSPGTPVVVLSMHADESLVTRSLVAGADAYVIKSAAYGELLEAIESVRNGRQHRRPDLKREDRPGAPGKAALPPMSETEREVLRFLGQGLEERDLVNILGIPFAAVEAVLSSLQERLGVPDLAALRHVGFRLKS